jgi:hypothetical protein
MKLLIFLCLFQFIFTFKAGLHVFSSTYVLASEISSSAEATQAYNDRYARWLQNKEQRLKALREKLNEQRQAPSINKAAQRAVTPEPSNQSTVQPTIQPTTLRREQSQPKASAQLQKALPSKTLRQPAALSEELASGLSEDSPAAQTSTRFKDAQSEFINNIPRDNKQVQSLLSMIDHTKVYFSINADGRLRDLFKDERFQEIYREEMTKPTRKQTYNFFKGYQDENRNPNEPLAKKLNRDVKITREKIDAYLQTTGIKSKLTRALQGRYPEPTPRSIESPNSDNGDGASSGDSIE